MKRFPDIYPELTQQYLILPTPLKDWLDDRCESRPFGQLISKFYVYQSNLGPNDAVSSFLAESAFLTGNRRLIKSILNEISLWMFENNLKLAYLLSATAGQELPTVQSDKTMISTKELLVAYSWLEWQEGRYSRVIGLLSNLSPEMIEEDPLFSSLLVFLLLSAYEQSQNRKDATIWKDEAKKQLNNPIFSDNRFFTGLFELAIGSWHNQWGDLSKSQDYLIRSLEKFEVFSNFSFIFQSSEQLGESYYKERKYQESYAILIRFLRKQKELEGDVEPLQLYRLENSLANLSYDIGNLNDAVGHAESAYKLFEKNKIPSREGVYLFTEFLAAKGDIDAARDILAKGMAADWIKFEGGREPEFFRVSATIEKHACNFALALDLFSTASELYKKTDIYQYLECLAEIIILRLEIYFWRKDEHIIREASTVADELRVLVEGQSLTGWSYISKALQAVTSAMAGDARQATKLMKETQNSQDIEFFSTEHESLITSIDLNLLPNSQLDTLGAIDYLNQILHIAHRSRWQIDEKESELLYLLILDSESSLPVFVYYFDPVIKIDRLLISGLISAINTMSRSLELKELHEIRYKDTLVLIGHRDPLIFSLVIDGDEATVGQRIQLLQLTETFPDYTIGEARFQMDFSDDQEIRGLVETIFGD
ncbi:MAG: hypothetical protein ACFFFG_13260 [Candidatus Thorarchaeota archaeon]